MVCPSQPVVTLGRCGPAECLANVSSTREHVAWRSDQSFQYHNVDMTSNSPQVHWHDSHRFCTTSTLQFFLYHTLVLRDACLAAKCMESADPSV